MMSKVDKETLKTIRCNTACDTCHVWCHENCVTHLHDLTRDSTYVAKYQCDICANIKTDL